jgi:hypothetical protein
MIPIYFRDKKIESVKELLDINNCKNISVTEFLDSINPVTGRKNREEVFLAYTKQQKKELSITTPADIGDSTPIYSPAVFWVAQDKINIDVISNENNFVRKESTNVFVGEEINKIINSSGYYLDTVNKTYPKCSVWIWIKTMENNRNQTGTISQNIVGRLINVSSFVQNINISVTETGGNFSISLPFIPASASYAKSESSSYDTIDFDMEQIRMLGGEEYVIDTTLFKYGERRINFLNVAMQANDLVFIKLEKLQVEKDTIIDDLFLNPSNLPNQYYDMIGLIDKVPQNVSPEDTSVTVTGRDLMKLFIDDGTFFFPNSFVSKTFDQGLFINSKGQADAANANSKTFNGIKSSWRWIN